MPEEDELAFIKAFRKLMWIKNVLTAFSDFNWDDLQMPEQVFEDFKSKYLDLYEKVKPGHQKEKISILEDVDFEPELIEGERPSQLQHKKRGERILLRIKGFVERSIDGMNLS